ncbi:hypothetical protein [Mucilaginibacter phyllosphaerae]|uniref:Lipoprotein n=1 Tax=Mucilaginibacter phyllosphaerae TaxID=1812349 RepID=A0A4Y8AB83_9SPHI|nr:hypothetical protein [Mucilaginibacter phyllosphaerae]MBB3969469.1 hypothetical protein [Mucilaginibacter phyllosphaerae]TEW65750.1 hypothetical protein E2R65_11445 [Mucilaginibacter phyllosphaerae]GGH08799.1 hypothetical protein GCM10007352_13990 [Mucilaginibacter phyllosphaerae]
MKKLTAILLIAVSVTAIACKGNPQGAMGANDKPDTTAFDKEDDETGRPAATKNDTTDKNIGPGNDKNHVADSEHKKKH